MNEYTTVISISATVIVFLTGIGVRSVLQRISRLEEETVSDAMLEAKLNTIEEKIKAVTSNIEKAGAANKEDHQILFRVLEDIKDCVTKLAAGQTEC